MPNSAEEAATDAAATPANDADEKVPLDELRRLSRPMQFGISSFVYSARRPFESQRLAALLNQWPRDPATPLNAVSAEAGLDVQVGLSEAEEAAQAARQAAEWVAANPGRPPLRFTPGDPVECNVGTWAAGKVIRIWYEAVSYTHLTLPTICSV